MCPRARSEGRVMSRAPFADLARRENLIRIPRRFLDDHQDRDLPSPEIQHETRTHVWVDGSDPALPELISDARFYCDTYGPDMAPAGLKVAARALLKALGGSHV